jgi:hypothetical protein
VNYVRRRIGMSDYSVIDTVAAYTLEPGDIIDFNNEIFTVRTVLDTDDNVIVGLEDAMGDIEEYPFLTFGLVNILAIIEEDVFI